MRVNLMNLVCFISDTINMGFIKNNNSFSYFQFKHTHNGRGDINSPLTQWWMVRQPEMFGHNAKDGVLVAPLAEAGPSWVLMEMEPHTSSLTFTSTANSVLEGQKCIPLTLTVMFTGPL